MPWCPSPGASCPTYRRRMAPGHVRDQQVRPADQLKAIEILLDRGFGRSPQQLDVAHSVSDRPFANLSDETLRQLVENARQLEEGSSNIVITV